MSAARLIALAAQSRHLLAQARAFRPHREAFDWTPEQRHERALQEAAYRADRLRGLPSVFAETEDEPC